ncbi:quinoprotein relay system zinc metallohydrolase 2 [uncultured Roseobacter sp.]|uniref:quinoprotein relay system zinc metallohydrolase 2 n=1 Tax=uncultured Roseobacter sp. TaxID=114847 RepID=UPI002633979E|nr:quinoprotein relay system zinc metallohydrolase 2 [uncultured Roseobacter sp.]
MFEAVILACLVSAPEICRAQLIPGYEAADLAGCAGALRARPPALPRDPGLQFADNPECRAAGPALDMQEAAPGVFVHMGAVEEPDTGNLGDVSNLGFVVGETHVAVIDTGTARWMGEALWRAIRQRTELPVSHVILTHMHPDHVLGATAFAGTGAQIVGHDALPRALLDRQANYIESLDRLIGAQAMIGTRGPVIDVTVDEALTLDLGARRVHLRAWPLAHTGSDITVFDETSGTLFTGDLVFHRHTPALDGSLTGWRAVLAEMATLEVARIVPGHGGPVLDWPEGAEGLNRYLKVLETDTRAAIDAGTRLGEAVETIGAEERGNWALFEAYNPRNATVAFTELEWD